MLELGEKHSCLARHSMQIRASTDQIRPDQLRSDQVPPTVLIHRLNVGSSGQQLLDRLLQTATSRQVKRTGRDEHSHEVYKSNVKKYKDDTFFTWIRLHLCVGVLDTHVCSAAFVAFISAESGSFSRINNTQSSFPCENNTSCYSQFYQLT